MPDRRIVPHRPVPSPVLRSVLLALVASGLSCARSGTPAAPAPSAGAEVAPEVPAAEAVPMDPAPPVDPEPDTRSWAERTLAELSLREKVGQMLMPWVIGDFAPEGSPSHDRISTLVENEAVGGVIMSVGSPTEVAAKINDLQRHAKVPLLVAADLETGAGFRMRGAVFMPGIIELGGATDFPSLMAVGATWEAGLAYEMGRITGLEARAVGIHVPFAPVLDVNSNPDNPIINVRSFGEDPGHVAMMGAAFVRGVQDHGAIATGKHFPGHGDTGVDSHLELPVIEASRQRMDSVELRPFQAAIDAGMGAVMTAHITVPAVNGGNGDAATLSPAVLTGLLRGEMAFKGLLFTDAMDMRAVAGRLGAGEASVRAVEAGADVILMPPSVPVALKAILDAVCEGRIPEERIDDAVLRLLEAKESLGLHEERTVDLTEIPRKVGTPAHTRVADEIAEKSLVLLRNGNNLLPLLGTSSARVLSVTYRRTSDVLAGRYFNRHLRQTYPRLATVDVDPSSLSQLTDEVLARARRSALVVVSTYVTAVSYSGSVALPEEVSEFVQTLGDLGVPHMVISFGNPYLITEFPEVQAYLLAWSGAEASQRAAARAILGELEIQGRTPTRIPGFAEIGDGIRLPRKEALTGG